MQIARRLLTLEDWAVIAAVTAAGLTNREFGAQVSCNHMVVLREQRRTATRTTCIDRSPQVSLM